MNQTTIATIQACGFDVYMQNPCDTFLVFTDGTRLGYLQEERFGGVSISTMHVPNTTTGTGFRMTEGDGLTRETLERGFAFAPGWASSRDLASVKKWPSVDAWRNASNFNKGYALVAKA